MSRRFLQLGRLLILAALFGMLELHWVGLQSVAWVRMIGSEMNTERSATTGDFFEVVVRNVSGRVQCDLCRTIVEGKSREKDKDGEAPTIRRVELVPAGCQLVFLLPEAGRRLALGFASESGETRAVAPLLQPPRSC